MTFRWRAVCLETASDGEGKPMPYRIDRVSTDRGLILSVSGRLAAEDLELIRMALDGRRLVLAPE